jgi:hypothetical protein
MSSRESNKEKAQFTDGRGAYWLQQYAAAFTSGDKRAAAVALRFAREHNAVLVRAEDKPKQLG